MRYIKCFRCLHPRANPWPSSSSQSDLLPQCSAKSTLITNHLLVHQARRRRNDVSYYCRSNTTYCTYWPDCLQSCSSSLSGRTSQPSTRFRAGQLHHTHRGSTSTIYALAAVIVGKGERTRRSLQRPPTCNENCKQLACTSLHCLCMKVGSASNITELSAIQQARAMCSRRQKDGLHHDGWLTPATRCGLYSRALNEVTDHRQ